MKTLLLIAISGLVITATMGWVLLLIDAVKGLVRLLVLGEVTDEDE